ncbi:MAG: zinc ribbon domain-containing protein [Planctomycetota bacterium]|nr:zinc ribbon domain-containing protein [Planctomycetota bacterium]
MPIFEYVCTDCSNEFELLVRGEESTSCPNCDSSKLEKQFSVTSAPQSSNNSLPIASPQNCSAPRCCRGGYQS